MRTCWLSCGIWFAHSNQHDRHALHQHPRRTSDASVCACVCACVCVCGGGWRCNRAEIKISTKQKELIIPHWAALIYINRVDFAVNARWNAFFLICMQIWFTDEWFDVSSAAPPRHKRQIARWQSLLNMHHFHTAHVYVTNSFTITQLQGDFDQGNEKKKAKQNITTGPTPSSWR